MKRHRYVDIKILEQTVYHAHYRMISAHILAGALGNSKDNGRSVLLCGQKNRFRPLKVIDVELADCIMTCLCLFEHFCCRN